MALQDLPPEEAHNFNRIKEYYRLKKYESGLELANVILENFPNHGETLSLKALLLKSMGQISEAYQLASKGIKNNPKSHVWWHIYGLLHKSDKLHVEAIKCYQNALENDPDNIEILQDLSLVQAQMRDMAGFVETRQCLLKLKPNCHYNWIGLALAHHLNSNCTEAVFILEKYEEILENDYSSYSGRERHEFGEVLLYKISLLEESGFLERALEELKNKESKIVDKLAVKEQQVSLLLKLERLHEGKKKYKELLSVNSENYRYHAGLQKCLGLSPENGQFSSYQIEKLESLYKLLRTEYSGSSAVERIPLDFLQGKKFQEAAASYIMPLLTKGVPSLFSDLRPLYEHPGKGNLIEELILKFERSLKTNGGYPGSAKEPALTLVWTLFLLSQHYDRGGKYGTALTKIDEAIQLNPSIVDLYLVKGKILKHAGDLTGAAALADKAMRMKPLDHFLSRKCVKRMLQADDVGMAEKTAMFKKLEDDQDDHDNLQNLWYEIALGESYFRQGDIGHALEKFLAVEKCCTDMRESLFVFDSYYSRNMTHRNHVELLRSHDLMPSYAYFHKAVAGAVRCYIKIYDSTSEVVENLKLLPSQNKVRDPLSEATKYVNLLQKSSSNSLETHLLTFELSMRKQKMLLALQALYKLMHLDKISPDTHCCLMRFLSKMVNMAPPVTPSETLVSNVLKKCFESFLRSQIPLTRINDDFSKKHKDSLMHIVAVGEISFFLERGNKSEVVELIEEKAYEALGRMKKPRLEDCMAVHKLFWRVLDHSEAASRWTVKCRELFPLSNYFNPPEWLLDTGATRHFTATSSLLYNITESEKCVNFKTASGYKTSANLEGSFFLHSSHPRVRSIYVEEVVLTPGINGNILSIPDFVTQYPYVVEFFGDGYLIRDSKYEEDMPIDLYYIGGARQKSGPRYVCWSSIRDANQIDRRVTWDLDSGALFHATSDESILRGVKSCAKSYAQSAEGKRLPYEKVGSFTLHLEYGGLSHTLELNEVFVVEGLAGNNLISIARLTAENFCSLVITAGGYHIFDRRMVSISEVDRPDLIIVSGGMKNGKYIHVSQRHSSP